MEQQNKNVHSIDRNDPVAIAKQVGMTELTPQTSRAGDMHTGTRLSKRGRTLVALGTGAAVALGTAWAAAPRSHDAPQPDDSKDFTEQVAESAHVPYDASKDELVIDGLRIKPGNPNRNTPSEAVLDSPEVKAFVAAHPDESSSITTSAMSLPGGEEFGVAMRDVDHDGDKDAIAVEIQDHPLVQIEDKTIR